MEHIGTIILEQLLKMQWLSDFIAAALGAMGVNMASPIGASVHFFIYDTIKIVILLTVMVFAISYVQSYFPPERSRRIMGRFRGIAGNVVGALLGTVTPFCSCSSIPIFIGFTRAGLPLGVTFSFLISSPMVDIGSLVLIMSIFGPSIAVVYTVVGLVIAIVGGTIIQHLGMDGEVADFVHGDFVDDEVMLSMTRRERLAHAATETRSTFKKVFPFILAGVGVGPSSTTGSPKKPSSLSSAWTTRSPSCSPRSSACPSTPTPSAPSPSPRRSTSRAWDWAPCSPS